MARKIKTEFEKQTARLEKLTDAVFNRIGNGIQFSIMDLPKIMKAGVEAGRATDGKDVGVIESAVQVAIDTYRK